VGLQFKLDIFQEVFYPIVLYLLKENDMNISAAIKTRLKTSLTDSQHRAAKHLYYSLLHGNDLTKLAIAFGTDKRGKHHYTQHYQHHFAPLRRKKLNIIEIGIGGYSNPKGGGKSLRMWKAYFSQSHIFGIDIHDKTYHDEQRIKTFKGSQVDEDFLKRVVAEIGTVDIIIDDGSHYNDHIITTFKILFPLLSSNGIYVVEDLQTSYWEKVSGEHWGGSKDLMAPHTCMNFFKSLVDGLNYEEFTIDDYTPTYFDRHIISMHFYHNLVFIYKGQNNEGSNMLGKRFS
jgi:hypothetical protein